MADPRRPNSNFQFFHLFHRTISLLVESEAVCWNYRKGRKRFEFFLCVCVWLACSQRSGKSRASGHGRDGMERWNEQDYQIVFVANTNEHTAGHLPKSSRSPKHTHHHPHPPHYCSLSWGQIFVPKSSCSAFRCTGGQKLPVLCVEWNEAIRAAS